MFRYLCLECVLLGLVGLNIAHGQGVTRPTSTGPMPVYVTPYYDSAGPKIQVGPLSDELAKADQGTIAKVAAKLREQRESLPVETMFVAAIRLYDLGFKDEAVYWYYAAQCRARTASMILDESKFGGIGEAGFEMRAAFESFTELAGQYINVYAFGQLDSLTATLKKVAEEGQQLPDFAAIYPQAHFLPQKEWKSKNTEVLQGLQQLITYIEQNRDQIRATRRENGLE